MEGFHPPPSKACCVIEKLTQVKTPIALHLTGVQSHETRSDEFLHPLKYSVDRGVREG